MFEAVGKVAEKLIELAKYREERRGRRFNVIVRPLFEAFVEVHQDYSEMLGGVIQDLQAGNSLSVVRSTLVASRLRRVAKRRALLGQLRGLLDAEDLGDARQLLSLMCQYFGDTPTWNVADRLRALPLPGGTRTNMWIERLRGNEILQTLAPLVISRQEVLSEFEACVEDLNATFERASEEYSRLQLNAV